MWTLFPSFKTVALYLSLSLFKTSLVTLSLYSYIISVPHSLHFRKSVVLIVVWPQSLRVSMAKKCHPSLHYTLHVCLCFRTDNFILFFRFVRSGTDERIFVCRHNWNHNCHMSLWWISLMMNADFILCDPRGRAVCDSKEIGKSGCVFLLSFEDCCTLPYGGGQVC